MEMELNKQTYFEISKISSVKSYEYELANISIDELYLKTNINISLIYYDQSGAIKNKKLNIPIEILKDMDMEDIKISLDNLVFEVIEGQGTSCTYYIRLSFVEKIKAPNIQLPIIDNDSNVVEVKKESKEDGFIDFFKTKKQNYYKVKCLKVKNEDELKKISLDYKISINDLYKGYDSDKGYVVFNVRE